MVSRSRVRATLARVEAELGERILRARLENCSCRSDDDHVLVTDPEKFLALMKIPCKVHGIRKLGQIGTIETVGGARPARELEIDRLVGLYYRRLEQRSDPSKFGDELEK